MFMRVFALLLVAGALATWLFAANRGDEPLVVSGFVEADRIRLGSRVGGRVDTVHVKEGVRVTRGQLLVTFEPFDLLERRAEAEALLAQRRSEVARLEAGLRVEEIDQARARRDQLAARLEELENGSRTQDIEVARAQVELSGALLVLAKREEQRMRGLHEQSVTSTGDLDRAVRNLRVAEASVETDRQRLALQEEGPRREELERARAELREGQAALALAEAGYRDEDVAAARAAAEAAAARLAALERQIAELEVRASLDGWVEALRLRRGDLVAPGAPVLSLLDTSHLWVRAYVPTSRLKQQLGQSVEISVDAWPGERFPGRIEFIARDAEFTPNNVQTPEERGKQVFRIQVDLTGGDERLRPGMPADVHLEPEL